MHMKDLLNGQISEIEQSLTHEELRGPVEKLADLAIRHKAISRIDTHISRARRTLARLRKGYLAEYEQRLVEHRERWQYLSKLPRARDISWAQKVLLQNFLLVVRDEDEHPQTRDIIRLLAVDATGKVQFDRFIEPSAPLSEHVSSITGITPQDMAEASPIQDVWTDLLHIMSGRFILVSNIDEFKEQLEGYARLYELEWPVVLGTSFVPEIEKYFHISLRVAPLNQLCARLGHPLPPYPQQTAKDRAKGYLHILQAMAQGVIIIQPREQAIDDDWESEDHWTDDDWENEYPFSERQLEDDNDESEE